MFFSMIRLYVATLKPAAVVGGLVENNTFLSDCLTIFHSKSIGTTDS